MGAKLGVLVIHGVGSQGYNFADPMKKILKGKISDYDEICWESVWWAPALTDREKDLLDKLFPIENRPHCIEFRKYLIFKLRKFVVSYMGDATAYRYVPDNGSQTNNTYENIHRIVHDSIVNLRVGLGNTDKPVIVMAHSLGSVIMSDYIWDRQKKLQNHETDPYGNNELERMQTLAGFITFGSPIPLFTLAYRPVKSIKFPPDNLPGNLQILKDEATWLNFYDEDDVLGWPLKHLSNSYEARPIEDKPINVGGMLTSWNPLCHHEYWTDNSFTEPVAEYISKILNLC
jgi:hypothetical protein